MEGAKRLSPTSESIKFLLVRSGNQCAFPGCTHPIFNDNNVLVAQCCHIEAALPGGERFNPAQSDEDRRSPENLIFFCHAHHVQTNNVDVFTVETLKHIKKEHESRFSERKFAVHPEHVLQIEKSFEAILFNTKHTLDVVNRIEAKQEEIFSLLSTSQEVKRTDTTEVIDFFGAPAVHQFKGRQEDLENLRTSVSSYNSFQIGGISGVGKSSFVSVFLKDQNQSKHLWIDCWVIKSKEAFLELFARFINQELKDQDLHNILKQSGTEVALSVAVSVLNKYNIYLVFDGLDSNHHELFPVVRLLNKNVRLSKIFFTTHHDLDSFEWSNPVFKITLQGIAEKDFLELISIYADKRIDFQVSRRLHKAINGHPYLLKLSTAIASHQPMEILVENLENKNIYAISTYIKDRVIASLDANEIRFLQFVTILDIPFRYEVTKFVLEQESDWVLQSLSKKFLIEKKFTRWYDVPEFIKKQISISIAPGDITDNMHRTAVQYLMSFETDRRLFENLSLISHAIECHDSKLAKDIARRTLSGVMTEGDFKLAFKIAQDFINNKIPGFAYFYYVMGRVHRFQENYKSSLDMYQAAIENSDEKKFSLTLQFEKASLLVFLSEDSTEESLRQEAIQLYRKLQDSDDYNIALQSKAVLKAQFLFSKGDNNEAIRDLELMLNSVNQDVIQENIYASLWQMLGDRYLTAKQYKKALTCFDKSFDHYQKAIPIFGMNMIDGLFHLYQSVGRAYSKSGDKMEAVRVLSVATGLCYRFGLTTKLQKSLFDLGYRLILLEQYHQACQALTDYYGIIMQKLPIESHIDLRLVYGCLTFAHWYDGQYLDAVELLGLYTITCVQHQHPAPVSVVEADALISNTKILDFFNKRFYILVIPEGKTFDDLKSWITIVSDKRPDLAGALNSYEFMKAPDA